MFLIKIDPGNKASLLIRALEAIPFAVPQILPHLHDSPRLRGLGLLHLLRLQLRLHTLLLHSHIHCTPQNKRTPQHTKHTWISPKHQLVKDEREQHLRVHHIRRPTALLDLQPRRQEKLHREPADPQEDEVGPLLEVRGQEKRHPGQSDHRARRHKRAHGAEVVHAEQWVRPLPHPAHGRERHRLAQHPDKSDANGVKSLRGGDAVVVGVGVGGLGVWRGFRGGAVVEEGGGAGDQGDANEGDQGADLLHAGEGFFDEDGAGEAGDGGGDEGYDGGVGEGEVEEGVLKMVS